MQYHEKTLEAVRKVAEETGLVNSVADYLNISKSSLVTRRKECPLLDIAIRKGLLAYKEKRSLVQREFTKDELEDIADIVAKTNIDKAAVKYGSRADGFHDLRKTNKSLDEAIKRGQLLRKQRSSFVHILEKLKKLTTKQLDELTEIMIHNKLPAIAEHLDISVTYLSKARKELPSLDEAIKKGMETRPNGVTGRRDTGEKAKQPERKKYHKTPKEIINTTLLAIEDNSADALAKFRNMVQKRREQENIKRLRSGEFESLI